MRSTCTAGGIGISACVFVNVIEESSEYRKEVIAATNMAGCY